MKSRSLPLSQVLLLLFGSLLLSVNAQSLNGPIRMESPWQSCGADPSGLGLCAVISSEVYQRLQELSVGDTVVFRNLPLKTGGASVSAVMRRFSASESREDLPLVVLLRGAVFSEEREMEAALRDPLTSFDFYGLSPDSLAFLALSPFGSNGFLEFGNQTYYLSTPFESFDPENPNPLLDDYVISLARTASRFRGDDKWRKFSFGRASVITEKSELGGSHGANAPKVDAVLPPQEVIDETNARIEEYLRTQPKSNVRRTYRVATDVDYQLYQLKGYNWDATASYYYTIVGSSSSIYARDFGSDMVSSFLYIYTFQDSYPYSSGACLDHMTRNWNPSNPSRSFAALLSGKKLGGGIAYYRTLCNTQWAYAVNGDLSGYFPVPLRDYDYGNWDIYVWSHEAGHVWGASHTHELNPPADYCGVSPGCGATAGSIMSYCHTCSNGLGNIYLAFHQYTKNEVWPFIGSVAC